MASLGLVEGHQKLWTPNHLTSYDVIVARPSPLQVESVVVCVGAVLEGDVLHARHVEAGPPRAERHQEPGGVQLVRRHLEVQSLVEHRVLGADL